jgi:hypothetical protein
MLGWRKKTVGFGGGNLKSLFHGWTAGHHQMEVS